MDVSAKKINLIYRASSCDILVHRWKKAKGYLQSWTSRHLQVAGRSLVWLRMTGKISVIAVAKPSLIWTLYCVFHREVQLVTACRVVRNIRQKTKKKIIICTQNFCNPFTANVELKSTALSVVPDPVSSPNRYFLYNDLCWIFLSSCPLMAGFEIRDLWIFWKINLGADYWISQ